MAGIKQWLLTTTKWKVRLKNIDENIDQYIVLKTAKDAGKKRKRFISF